MFADLGCWVRIGTGLAMPRSGRTHINQSVSFPPALLAEAKERAKRLQLPFSAYVQRCLERDLDAREALVLEERGGTKEATKGKGLPAKAKSPE